MLLRAAFERRDYAGAGNVGGAGPLIAKFSSKIRRIIRCQRSIGVNCSAVVSNACNQRTTAMIRGFKSGASACKSRTARRRCPAWSLCLATPPSKRGRLVIAS